jgi:hypothetical protein
MRNRGGRVHRIVRRSWKMRLMQLDAMPRRHFRTHAEIQRQIEKARQVRAETASALILDGLASAMGLIRRMLARITISPRRA